MFLLCDRIIPTHVGSTAMPSPSVIFNANHSHACGINLLRSQERFAGHESFPRMWDQPFPD